MPNSMHLEYGEVLMWRLEATFSIEGRAVAGAHRTARGQYFVRGQHDRIGEEPRLVVDFNAGQPLFSVRGEQVGERRNGVVNLWDRQYRIHRPLPWFRGRFDIAVGEDTMLRARATSRRGATIWKLETHSAPDLDPIAALGLMLLHGRPHERTMLTEFF